MRHHHERLGVRTSGRGTVDITDEVTLGAANELSYSANYRGGAPGGGNISLSAYVTWSE